MDDSYVKRINKVIDMFKDEDLYKTCVGSSEQLSEWRVFRKYTRKILDVKWIEVIEDSLVALDTIVRNPRRFIIVEEDLIDTARAKSVGEEAVKYLATHTNFIEGMDGDMILPSKILNTTKEESFMVYENRFVYTLLRRLQGFVRERFDAVKEAAQKNEQLEVVVDKKLKLGVAQVGLRIDSIVKMPFEKALELNSEDLGPIERLAKISNIVNGFMVTPFAKEMFRSEPVRPPITRTNAILKNSNFKTALALWEFLQSYDGEGYETRTVSQCEQMDEDLKKQYRLLVFFNSLFMQNLANENFKVKKARIKLVDDSVETIENFPTTSVPIDEVKLISVPSAYDGSYMEVDKMAIIGAIDRSLAQYKINLAAEDGTLTQKQIVIQRKKENAYREKIKKLRKKERELLEKAERAKERERLRDENEAKAIEAERIRIEEAKRIEKNRQKELEKTVEEEMKILDQKAIDRVLKETKIEQINDNKAKISQEIIRLNTLRMKLKAQLSKEIDGEIDELVKQVPKLFNIKNDKEEN